MKLYYVTLNNPEEAEKISKILLEQKLAVCTNWFPISCAYRWEGKILSGSEIVLIIKTQSGYKEEIFKTISSQINYTNFMAEIAIESVNQGFLSWLNSEISID